MSEVEKGCVMLVQYGTVWYGMVPNSAVGYSVVQLCHNQHANGQEPDSTLLCIAQCNIPCNVHRNSRCNVHNTVA